MSIVFLSLGSNEGNRPGALEAARKAIKEVAGEIIAASSVYESEPWGFDSRTNFLNQVLKVETLLEPDKLIAVIMETEASHGRKRLPGSYSSRNIDIDILFYDNRIIHTGDLQIPHPRLHLRRFVMEPLAELDPEWIHPQLGLSVRQIFEQCEDTGLVVPYTGRDNIQESFDTFENTNSH